jgi:esterase/lipase
MVWLDDYDHAITRDPKRDDVFKLISNFIDRLDGSGGKRG